jgi:hypothetical protein
MAPNDDVERPRASSAAERQKSIVSMSEFEGMDEYTALQKYILFYRDAKTNPHASSAPKKKSWWQFWKSGSATANVVAQDANAVPEDCTYLLILYLAQLLAPHCTAPCPLSTPVTAPRPLQRPLTLLLNLHGHMRWLAMAWPELKLLLASNAVAARPVEPMMQAGSTKLPAPLHAR